MSVEDPVSEISTPGVSTPGVSTPAETIPSDAMPAAPPTPPPATQEQRQGQDRTQRLLFYGVLLLVIAGLYLVARPFLVPLAWAGILAICFWPVHARLVARWSSVAASAASTTALTLLLVVPTVLLGIALTRQGFGAVDRVQEAFAAGIPAPIAGAYAWVQDILPLPPLDELVAKATEVVKGAAGGIAKQAGSVLGGLIIVLFDVAVMVFALFFFFRDGPAIVAGLRRLLPFDDAHSVRLMVSSRDLIHASVTSGMIVAATQGLLGGILFACLGIDGAIFWGVVMGFLSLFPLFGSWLVWGPAAVWLLSTGHVTKGLVLIVLGTVLVGGVDNVLRPVLIGNRTSMGMLLLFIGLLGGVSAFGFIGLVLGPVVIAVALSLFEAYTVTGDRPETPTRASPPA